MILEKKTLHFRGVGTPDIAKAVKQHETPEWRFNGSENFMEGDGYILSLEFIKIDQEKTEDNFQETEREKARKTFLDRL